MTTTRLVVLGLVLTQLPLSAVCQRPAVGNVEIQTIGLVSARPIQVSKPSFGPTDSNNQPVWVPPIIITDGPVKPVVSLTATDKPITTRTLPRSTEPASAAEPSTRTLVTTVPKKAPFVPPLFVPSLPPPIPTTTTTVFRPGWVPPVTMINPSIQPEPPTPKTPKPFIIVVTDVTTINNQSANQTSYAALFGLPVFCSYSAVHNCSNVPLSQCKDCTMVGAGFFVFFVVVLGIAIISSNGIVIVLFVKGKSTFTGTYGKIKASLAFADILTGLLLFCVVFPNFSRTINSSPEELLRITLTSFGSPEASVGAVFFIFITTSSLYHLVLLAQQRLYAVKWPIKYKQQDENTVYIGIALVWVLALFFAVVPLFFPNIFSFAYQQLIFLFSLTMRNVTSNTVGPLIGVLVVVYLVPYLVMSGFTLATAIYIQKYIKRGSKMRSGDTGKREIMVFRTLATMQLGFTITMIPLLVIIVMSYSGVFTPYNIAAPYMVCFYLSMSNSLVNVMVYSVMDKKFRKSVRNLFVIRLRQKRQSKPSTSSGGKDRSTCKSKLSDVKRTTITANSTTSHHTVDTV